MQCRNDYNSVYGQLDMDEKIDYSKEVLKEAHLVDVDYKWK